MICDPILCQPLNCSRQVHPEELCCPVCEGDGGAGGSGGVLEEKWGVWVKLEPQGYKVGWSLSVPPP